MACEKLLEQEGCEFVITFISQCQPQLHEAVVDDGASGEEH